MATCGAIGLIPAIHALNRLWRNRAAKQNGERAKDPMVRRGGGTTTRRSVAEFVNGIDAKWPNGRVLRFVFCRSSAKPAFQVEFQLIMGNALAEFSVQALTD